MAILNKISDWLNKICMAISVSLLAAMVVVTTIQIICRVFFTALSWSEELARYILVWFTMIGAGCVYKSGGHISITALQDILPEGPRKYSDALVHAFCLLFFTVIFIYGVKYMGMLGTQKSASIPIQMKYIYLSIPLGSGIMAFHALTGIVKNLGKKAGEEE